MRVFRHSLLVLCFTLAACQLVGQSLQTQHLSIPTQTKSPATQQPTQQNQQGPTTRFEDVHAQAMQGSLLRAKEDLSDIKLPPIEILIESARNNPRVEFYDYRHKEEEAELKSVKRVWLKYFKLNTTYQYGLMGMTTSLQDNPNVPTFSTYSGTAQSWWNAGASISLPLDEIFDRGNRIRKQKARVAQTDYEMGAWYNEQKLKIIEAYTNAEMYLRLISIKSETMVLANQQYAMSRTDFINSRIDIGELNRLKSIQNIAVTEYEQTKAKLKEAILLLETLSNYRILNQ